MTIVKDCGRFLSDVERIRQITLRYSEHEGKDSQEEGGGHWIEGRSKATGKKKNTELYLQSKRDR